MKVGSGVVIWFIDEVIDNLGTVGVTGGDKYNLETFYDEENVQELKDFISEYEYVELIDRNDEFVIFEIDGNKITLDME